MFETLFQSFANDGAARLNVPQVFPIQVLQAQRACYLTRILGLGQIGLVGQNEHGHVCILRELQCFHHFNARLLEPLLVHRVDDKDDAVRAACIGNPEGTQLVLATNIPDGERYALVEVEKKGE